MRRQRYDFFPSARPSFTHAHGCVPQAFYLKLIFAQWRSATDFDKASASHPMLQGCVMQFMGRRTTALRLGLMPTRHRLFFRHSDPRITNRKGCPPGLLLKNPIPKSLIVSGAPLRFPQKSDPKITNRKGCPPSFFFKNLIQESQIARGVP